MVWFRRTPGGEGPRRRATIAEGLWIKCDSCVAERYQLKETLRRILAFFTPEPSTPS